MEVVSLISLLRVPPNLVRVHCFVLIFKAIIGVHLLHILHVHVHYIHLHLHVHYMCIVHVHVQCTYSCIHMYMYLVFLFSNIWRLELDHGLDRIPALAISSSLLCLVKCISGWSYSNFVFANKKIVLPVKCSVKLTFHKQLLNL